MAEHHTIEYFLEKGLSQEDAEVLLDGINDLLLLNPDLVTKEEVDKCINQTLET